jgi:hypothetical protein
VHPVDISVHPQAAGAELVAGGRCRGASAPNKGGCVHTFRRANASLQREWVETQTITPPGESEGLIEPPGPRVGCLHSSVYSAEACAAVDMARGQNIASAACNQVSNCTVTELQPHALTYNLFSSVYTAGYSGSPLSAADPTSGEHRAFGATLGLDVAANRMIIGGFTVRLCLCCACAPK